MIVAITIVLIIWALWFFWPAISRWLMRRGVEHLQNQAFRNMGIDPDEVKRQQRAARQEQKRRESSGGWSGQRQRTTRTGRRKIIPTGVGEYVDFEVLTLTGTEIWLTATADSPVFRTYRSETQITDIQYKIINDK